LIKGYSENHYGDVNYDSGLQVTCVPFPVGNRIHIALENVFTISRNAYSHGPDSTFVIGGYTPGPHGLDAVIVGHYVGGALHYVARTRNGFTPTSRAKLVRLLKPLETTACPFVNLPEAHSGRWGVGLTAEKMSECRWLRPELVAQFEYLEVTMDGHLRHARYVVLRDDKSARDVVRED